MGYIINFRKNVPFLICSLFVFCTALGPLQMKDAKEMRVIV